MTPDEYQRLSAAFDDALNLTPAERRRMFDVRFADQPALRAAIEELLQEHGRQDVPVATARGLDAFEESPSSGVEQGSQVGHSLPALKGEYRLLRVIGEGGMGVVFEAEQDFPRRRVALKAIRPGLATRAMLRRFRTEVELLARLHHPGIAQVFEAGFFKEHSANETFFVMELVDGLTLTKYASEHTLNVHQKLALLIAVCDAVQHAHHRGVIHRDLKPANILVTTAGQPKVLDFGIARAVDEGLDPTVAEALHTQPGQALGTPSYMSPEQLAGEPVDTRTDVYSLGVIAYELLSGVIPHDFSQLPLPEVLRMLRERRPRPLGQLDSNLSGDIETIVSLAMHPDVARRYSSAAAFADDIKSVLENRPIQARQDSAIYVLTKLARRNRTAVVLSTMLLIALLAFGVISTLMASRNAQLAFEATNARDKALAETTRANQLSKTLADELAIARIERGRAEAAAGKLRIAEETLWPEYFANPQSPSAHWALWEMYHQMPCVWTVQAESEVGAGVISPDGAMIALGLNSGAIVLRHGSDASVVARLDGLGSRVTSIAFSRDSRFVAIGLASGRLALVRVSDSLTPVFLDSDANKPAHPRGVTALAFSGDGHRLVAGGQDRRVSLWDTTNAPGTVALLDAWDALSDYVNTLAIDYDGTNIVAANRTGAESIKHWKVANRSREEHRISIGPTSEALSFARFDDAPSRRSIMRFAHWGYAWGEVDISTSSVRYLGSGLPGSVSDLRLSNDGRTVAIATASTLQLVSATSETDTHRSISLGQQRDNLFSAGWLPDGKVITLSRTGLIRCFDAREEPSATRLTGYQSWCFSSAWSPDGQLFAFQAGVLGIALHRAETLQSLRMIDRGTMSRNRAMAFLGDSHTLVLTGADGRLYLLNTRADSPPLALGDSGPETYSMAITPDEKHIVTGHASGAIKLWSMESRTLARELPKLQRRVEGVSISRDGKLLATSGLPNAIQLWDTTQWTQTETIQTSATPWAVAFSPSGALIAATTYDGTLEVFDVVTHECEARIAAHQRLATSLAYSSDGALLATCSEDGSARLWDAKSWRPLLTFNCNAGEATSAAFSPDSRYLSVGTAGRTMIVYDLLAMDTAIEGNREYQRSLLQGKIMAPEK